MADNVLTGSSIASFKGIELHRYLVSFTDSRGPRVVEHSFPKRDGGKQEVMGRRPHRTEWQLTFTGPNWITTLKQLVASIDADPSGLLVHPIYGQMQVVCQGFDRAVVNLPEATDTISVPLAFVEDDQALDDASVSQGVAAQQQNVTSSVADFQTAAAPYSAPATVTATAALASAANAYATAAAAAALSNTIDPSLDSKLATVALSTEAAIAAISIDPLGVGTAATYDALAAAEVVYSACQDLADAALADGPAVVEYVVAGTTSIAVLAAALYGKDALVYIDQLLSLNPIPDPTAIPSGTVLLVPSI
jgi:prophage DNA circulation protein